MKKMNQIKQVLNTCSPLEKVVKINEALGTGVNTLSKKLCSDCKQGNPREACRSSRQKHEPTVAKTTEQQICDPCAKYKPKEQQTSASDVPGCMPFTDDVPLIPHHEEQPPDPDYRTHPSLQNKGCGCNLGTTIPPEDRDV